MKKAVILFIIFFATGAYAELHDRGGGLIYDDALNVTWLQDANFPKTSGYNSTGIMRSWTDANNWTTSLVYYDPIRNKYWDDWRLPKTDRFGDWPYEGWHDTDSEMGHLYYVTLSNLAWVDRTWSTPPPGYGLTNRGPFINIETAPYGGPYWSQMIEWCDAHPSSGSCEPSEQWRFYWLNGYNGAPGGGLYVWPVRDGDVLPPNNSPILNPIGAREGNENALLEFIITATDQDEFNLLTFTANNLPSGASFAQIDNNSALFSWTPDYDQAGNYENVEFTVTDNGSPVELDTELIILTIGNVNRAPIFTPVGPQTVEEGQQLEFYIEAIDPDGNNVTLSSSHSSFNSVTGLFSWTTGYLDEGTYTVTFIATDDGDPIESNEMGVPITVGNKPNPTQLTDDLINDIENSSLPNNVINSYLANLKKVNTFIEKGKITPAGNQIFTFICKVEEDLTQGIIDQIVGDNYIFRATEIVEDLGVEPSSRVCE